jgi:hypothetical protein
MAAADYDLLIEQGATFDLSIVWKDNEGTPIDLTGYSARMQIRKNYDTEPVISLTSDSDGGIVLGGEDGTIDITIDAETTENIEIRRGRYDLEIELAGIVTRLTQGTVDISREVTKDD